MSNASDTDTRQSYFPESWEAVAKSRVELNISETAASARYQFAIW